MKLGPQQIVIVPVTMPTIEGQPLWQVMVEGFEESSPLPRGWRGTIDDVMEQVLYVATNHDLTRGTADSPNRQGDLKARIGRYQEFFGRFCDMVELRVERDRLKRENEALREQLSSVNA
jgi:hypothetical protein